MAIVFLILILLHNNAANIGPNINGKITCNIFNNRLNIIAINNMIKLLIKFASKYHSTFVKSKSQNF